MAGVMVIEKVLPVLVRSSGITEDSAPIKGGPAPGPVRDENSAPARTSTPLAGAFCCSLSRSVESCFWSFSGLKSE
jgi:hypothetical protein